MGELGGNLATAVACAAVMPGLTRPMSHWLWFSRSLRRFHPLISGRREWATRRRARECVRVTLKCWGRLQ